jgi:glycosyltransferase involved in cell wall biosynthesis
VLAHLRAVKDPLLAAAAVRLLPPSVPCRVVLCGGVLEAPFASAALAARSDRFVWIGEQSRRAARALLRESHLCLVTSRDEGGANVISEAIAAGTPVLATAVPGNTGLLGNDWPGLFPPGDAQALATLLVRAATDPAYSAELQHRTEQLQGMVAPARERAALAALLAEMGVRAE